MACALDYLGMTADQLEGNVFAHQKALWALAQQAIGYELTSVPYDPEHELTGEAAPNSQRGDWIEPEELEPPEIADLSSPPFEPQVVSENFSQASVTIPTRPDHHISLAEPTVPGRFTQRPPEQPQLLTPEVSAADELLTLTEAILSELRVPSIVELTVRNEPTVPPDLNLDVHTQAVHYAGSNYTPTPALVAKIMEWLQGGTRMPDAVWSMIIDKAVSQAMNKARQDTDQVLEDCAGKGWDYPTGPAHKQMRQIQYGLLTIEQDKIAEILAAQAKQELENLQLAVSQGTALEGMLVDGWNSERMRELSAAKATVKLAVDTIDVKLALVDARTARYLAQAEVYATVVRQAVWPYKRYALAVEAQSIDNLQNENATKKYVAEMRNLLPYAKKFAAEMDTVRIVAEHNKNLAIRYRTAVSAGAKQYLASEEEWKGTLARHELPKLEAERHRILSSSFAERTRAWVAGIELEGTKVRADSAEKRSENKRVEQDIQRFLEEVQAKQTESESKYRSWSAFYGTYDDYYSAWSSAIGADEANQRAELIAKILNDNAAIAKLREDYEILAAQRRLLIEQDGGNAEIKSNHSAAMYNMIHVATSAAANQTIAAASTCETTSS